MQSGIISRNAKRLCPSKPVVSVLTAEGIAALTDFSQGCDLNPAQLAELGKAGAGKAPIGKENHAQKVGR